jgi:hypothetical protein
MDGFFWKNSIAQNPELAAAPESVLASDSALATYARRSFVSAIQPAQPE